MMYKDAAKWVRRVVDALQRAGKQVPDSVYELRHAYKLRQATPGMGWHNDPLTYWDQLNATFGSGQSGIDIKGPLTRHSYIAPLSPREISEAMANRKGIGIGRKALEAFIGPREVHRLAADIDKKEYLRTLVRMGNPKYFDIPLPTQAQRISHAMDQARKQVNWAGRIGTTSEPGELPKILSVSPFATYRDFRSGGDYGLLPFEYMLDRDALRSMRGIYEQKIPLDASVVVAGKPMSAKEFATRYRNNPKLLFKGETARGGGIRSVMPESWNHYNSPNGVWFSPRPQVALSYADLADPAKREALMAVMEVPNRWARLTELMTTPHIAHELEDKMLWANRHSRSGNPKYGDPYFETKIPRYAIDKYRSSSPGIQVYRVTKSPNSKFEVPDTYKGFGLQDLTGMDNLTFTPVKMFPEYYNGRNGLKVPLKYRAYM